MGIYFGSTFSTKTQRLYNSAGAAFAEIFPTKLFYICYYSFFTQASKRVGEDIKGNREVEKRLGALTNLGKPCIQFSMFSMAIIPFLIPLQHIVKCFASNYIWWLLRNIITSPINVDKVSTVSLWPPATLNRGGVWMSSFFWFWLIKGTNNCTYVELWIAASFNLMCKHKRHLLKEKDPHEARSCFFGCLVWPRIDFACDACLSASDVKSFKTPFTILGNTGYGTFSV